MRSHLHCLGKRLFRLVAAILLCGPAAIWADSRGSEEPLAPALMLAVTWLAAAANVYFGLSPWLQNTLASRGARMLLGETP